MGLISRTIMVKWHSKTREWYENRGYKFTKYKDEFEVKVEDLQDGTHSCVNTQCDECGKILENVIWQNYLKCVKKDKKYYCNKCSIKLFGKDKELKTKLLNSISFGYWLIKNLSLKEAIEIILRWDDEKNGKDIREVGYSSSGKNKKGYWFKCPRNLHPSELKHINNFTNGYNGAIDCVSCNSIAQYGYDNINRDFLSKYWDWERNEELGIDPWKISKYSNKKVWLFCQEKSYHGSYFIQCNDFYNNIRCSYCGNRKVHRFDSLGWLYPQVFNIWSEKNKKSPYDYKPFSIEKIYWKCFDNKHKDYKRKISNSNIQEFRCSLCTEEKIESILQGKVKLYLELLKYNVLTEYNCTLIPQNPKVNNKKGQLPFDNEIELTNAKHLICEVNGIQHYEELSEKNSWLNGLSPKKYLHQRKLYDRYKRFIAYKNGYEYLEIPYWTDDNEETYKKIINDKINEILYTDLQMTNIV